MHALIGQKVINSKGESFTADDIVKDKVVSIVLEAT